MYTCKHRYHGRLKKSQAPLACQDLHETIDEARACVCMREKLTDDRGDPMRGMWDIWECAWDEGVVGWGCKDLGAWVPTSIVAYDTTKK